MNKKLVFLFFFLLSVVMVKAQTITVKGNVADQNSIPLPGVNILEKNTNNGVATDFDGNYSITVSSSNAVLQFSSIGFATQEVTVGNQSTINIVMQEDAAALDEVVLIGYGAVKKRDLTGAVAQVNLENMGVTPNVSVIQGLRGSVAGLNVGATTTAGEEASISIRGQNTLSSGAGNSPLIVLDGAIYRGNVVDLNTSDIESIDVLKDASSAAIYGSQAANGVIIITTKTGKSLSEPIMEYNASYSFQTPSNELKPMNSAELTEYYPDIFWRQSRLAPDYLQPNPDYNLSNTLKTVDISNGFSEGLDTPWWDLLTNNGFVNKHSLSVRGKTESVGYYISGGVDDAQGFIKNDLYTKYTLRVNVDTKVNDWLKVGVQSFMTSSDYSGASPDAQSLYAFQPWAPIKDDQGNFIIQPEGQRLNPFLEIDQQDSDKRLNLFANVFAEIKLPIEGLKYRMNYANNLRTTNQDNFNPWGASFTGLGVKNSYREYIYSLDNILTYNKTFNDVHKLDATLVYGVEKIENSFTEAGAQSFGNILLGYNALEAGDPTQRLLNTGKEQESSLYTMGRLAYTYDNKYFLTGTVRRDGFSGFGEKNKFAVFPSVALAWTASEEDFIKDKADWLDYLKFRLSYGQTGRRGLERYDTQAIIQAQPSIIFGDGGSPNVGKWITSLPNDNLSWETTTGINVGIDFTLFNSKLSGNIEYYNNDTKDILYPIQLPLITGFSGVNTNIGNVANHGLEMTLNTKIMDKGDFKWDAMFNFSRNRNKIVSILGKQNDNDGDGIEDDLVANQLFIGEPTDVFYDYDIEGMWQLADEAAGNIPDGFFPGTFKVRDIDGDGVLTAAGDRKIQGYRDPSYRFSIANTFNYKGFRLYFLINSIQGGKDFYYGEEDVTLGEEPVGNPLFRDHYGWRNIPKGAWDYWVPENPDARFPQIYDRAAINPNRYAQRNFIRLQELSLSYTFDSSVIEKLKIGRLKLFVSGTNLATITNWKGWDPETGSGLLNGQLPLMSSYTLGLNVEF